MAIASVGTETRTDSGRESGDFDSASAMGTETFSKSGGEPRDADAANLITHHAMAVVEHMHESKEPLLGTMTKTGAGGEHSDSDRAPGGHSSVIPVEH